MHPRIKAGFFEVVESISGFGAIKHLFTESNITACAITCQILILYAIITFQLRERMLHISGGCDIKTYVNQKSINIIADINNKTI